MKIAMIIERMDVTLGGAERSVSELAEALSSLGVNVNILAAKGKVNDKNIHILCENTPGKRTGYLKFTKALKKHLLDNQCDIIHSVLPFDFADVYQPRGGCYAEAVLRNAASYQNKLFESYKSLTAFANFRRTTLWRAEKRLCKNSNGPVIVALSKYVAEQFKKHYGVSDDRIIIIPNGIKINKRIDTDQADKLRGHIFAELNIKETDEPALFLFAANNFRLKGLSPLIKAMQLASFEKSERKAFLIVAGSDGTRKYSRLAEKLNLQKRIVFGGSIPNIQNALSIVDAAVLPTFYDPSSRFILEALAAGKPVITTKFNGAADLFVGERHGKIINCPENIPALAKALRHFTDTNNIRNASQAIVEDNLGEKVSISRVAERLIPLYESILKKRRRL
ncbi:MAG: glycosyltransferase family 4 protein [Sedimentisphaerales bacterium]|nr:glycosyltransferase family 4 protein [Sedimentisphaerales bacterium]